MIIGEITADREAVVPLRVNGANGQGKDIKAILDTGFSGFLSLLPDLIAELQLPFLDYTEYELGNGNPILFAVHEATVIWDGRERNVPVLASDTDPLVGMSLLYGCNLNLDVVDGGPVRIVKLA